MNRNQLYTVADHSFCVVMEKIDVLWQKMAKCYSPFEENNSVKPLFTLTVCKELLNIEQATVVFLDPNTNPQEAKTDVYHTEFGYLFKLTPYFNSNKHSLLHLSNDLQTAELFLCGSDIDRFYGVNTALMLCYLLSTAQMNTLLIHASVVVNEGRGYLFLGRSGTGKSTHSKLWEQSIIGTKLLNDDHPIIRANKQGEAIVYGSPWSGKTPCYRNESAPIGGIVRIKRALYNQIKQLSPIESYASLLTSCSGMSWDKRFADGKNNTLQQIITTTSCYILECLPNEAAAQLCAQVIKKSDVHKAS